MRLIKLAGVTGLFVGGWACGTLTNRFAHADLAAKATAPSTSDSAAASSNTCIDREAMAANANLVGELHDSKSRVARAEEDAARAKAAAATAVSTNTHPRLTTSEDDWARMAKDGTVRLRLPCSHWSDPANFAVLNGRPGIRMGSTYRSYETNRRAELAGLSPEELETLNTVYTRTHARTWAAMRATCEANAAYREQLADAEQSAREAAAESSEDDNNNAVVSEMTDETRVQICRTSIVDMTSPTARSAITRVAELRAAGFGIEKADNDEQRVLHALTSSSTNLYDEMVNALGKEKATRALDNGVLCVSEMVYDTRPPTPPPEPLVVDHEVDEQENVTM